MQPVGRLGAAFRRRVRPLGAVALAVALLATSHGPWGQARCRGACDGCGPAIGA